MADKDDPPPLSICLMPEDHAWLARVALDEGMSVPAVLNHAVRHFRNWQEKGKQLLSDVLDAIDVSRAEYQEQVRRQLYFQRMYQIQVRRQHDLRRAYERELWRERGLRRICERRLRRERGLRRAYEALLQRQHDYYERRLTAATVTAQSTLDGCKVARLVALGLSSDSEAEAATAFAKARELHHLIA